MKPVEWKLFALCYSADNVSFSSGFRFSRVTADYILVYAQKDRLNPPDGKAARVTETELGRLTKADETWLFDCAVSLAAEHAASRKEDGLRRLGEMVSKFEAELERESLESGDEI